MFKSAADAAGDDVAKALTYMIKNVDAIDPDRKLVMFTTNGRTHGARRWIVIRANEKGFPDYQSEERFRFRAWDLDEAIEKANTDTRTVNAIAKKFE